MVTVVGLLLMAATASASEVDSVTTRLASRANARPYLNALVRTAFRDSATAASQSSAGRCQASDLRSELRLRLGSPTVIGQTELRILIDPRFPIVQESLGTSVFQDFPFLEFPQMWAVGLTLARLMRFDKHFIGTDKIGHFFDEGFTYFEMIHREGRRLNDVLDWGMETERGSLGLAMNGVFSWGDLVANYRGLRFWQNVATRYFACEDGRWTVVRNFDFSHYVDAGWDEGINCPEFRNASLAAGVQRRIRAIEAVRGERLTCPISAHECRSLKRKYAPVDDRLLSPLCRNIPNALPTGE